MFGDSATAASKDGGKDGAGELVIPQRSTRTAQFLLLEFCPATLGDFVADWDYPVPWVRVGPFALDLVTAIEVGRRTLRGSACR